jgi:hypothetical protein
LEGSSPTTFKSIVSVTLPVKCQRFVALFSSISMTVKLICSLLSRFSYISSSFCLLFQAFVHGFISSSLEHNHITQDSAFHSALVFVVVIVVVVCLFVQVFSDNNLCPWVCVSRLLEEEFCVDSLIVSDETLRVFKTPGNTNPTTQCNKTKDLKYQEQFGSISHFPFSY